jgi:uncharacterized protein YjbI with pentapeptide repeats
MKRTVVAGANLDHALLDDVDMTEVLQAPPPIFYVDDRPLDEVLSDHELYCDTQGRKGAVIALPEVDFRPMRTLKGRRLTGLVARDSIFFGLDLQRAQLQGADLSGCDLRGSDLREADLRGAKLVGAQLTRADLRGAKLGPLMIAEGRFVRTDLTRATLRAADLRGAMARRARMLEADLTQARLAGCDLAGAEMEA